MLRLTSFSFCLFVASFLFAAEVQFSTEQLEFFEKNIRPLFIEHCHECHGAETQEAALRLDSREFVLKGGDTGPAVVPGRVKEGELFQALLYDPDGYQMPPDGKLPEDKIKLVKQWIEMGAPWPKEEVQSQAHSSKFDLQERAKHWSFQPLAKVKPPEVNDSGWSLNEVDQFILSKLQEHQLSPAAETDRRTWLRRASLDVIGLPPSIEELNAFLADESDDAYEKVIDRLLAAPQFGERWGRHWLDVVRYAESRGHEFDYNAANAWQYRDYVIRALNANVPFDQFVVEHIAGDLLNEKTPHARRVNPATGGNESILGTGFWLLGEWVHSPVDIRQEEADRFDNMIDVYSKAFLGMTVACARCHDHKFDPIRQKDYYALQGFLQSSSYQQARFETMLKNESIVEELNTLQEQAQEKLRRFLVADPQTTEKEFIAYETAAIAFTLQHPLQNKQTIFEDFESGTYDRWQVEGDAFGAIPQTQSTVMEYQGNVLAQGKFFVNSHQRRNGGSGDVATGKMTSAEFTITFNQIQMLVGGGNHAGKTCVNLIINDNVVRSSTGKNSNQMSEVTWDVHDLKGQVARIQIVDEKQGSWGNIGVDHILFLNKSNQHEIIADFAQQKNLNSDRLQRWIAHLTPPHDKPDLLTVLATLAKQSTPSLNADQLETHYSAHDLMTTGPGYRLVEKEDALLNSILDRRSGVNALPPQNDYVEWDPFWSDLKQPQTNQSEPGALGSWKREGRILRSPTFEINSGKIHCLVRGAVNTYVAVDSHILLNGPLHKALIKSHPQNEKWHWITHNVSAYQDHHAHIEFIPKDDRGFAVQAIFQTKTLKDAKNAFASTSTQDTDAEFLNFSAEYSALFDLDSNSKQIAKQKIIEDYQRRKKLISERAEFLSATAPCLLDGTPDDEYVFIRGNWKKKGETVPRRFLEVFHGEETKNTGSGRLQLAEQMIDPAQTPILPRVIANRIWHHYFGRGICPTPNDFGHLGQRPTHPELLDWLANELVAADWSVKAVHRKILLSATYRMSSQVNDDPHVVEVDPNNDLLHRMNVKRLEGEAIRDSILSVAGSLDQQMYGPSIPIHLTNFLEGRGRPGQSGPVDGHGRRSLYLSVRRNFAEPFFQAFDFPTPHSSVGRRNVSNVPAQALALMNNAMVIEQSKKWATKLIESNQERSLEEKVQILFQQAFSRTATAEEMELAKQFISAQLESLNGTENDPTVWQDYCHVLLNSKEFIFVR